MVDIHEAVKHLSKTIYLDIETTGLSRVYDRVTLIGYDTGDKFHYIVSPRDVEDFQQAMSRSKVMVTFNGTCFDVKFLEYHFPGLKFPPHHIDLRYLLRRAGYVGGQKKIEVELGLSRPEDIKGLTGYEAVVLYHEYRRGSNEALEKLVAYNHADVQGMKYMLGHALKKLHNIDVGHNASALKLKKEKSEPEKPRPLISAKKLWSRVSDQKPIVGIDITGSELRPSGFAIIYPDGGTVTSQLMTDKEIVVACLASGANMISIDSPLGIPKGRTMVTDDDPMRDEIGIMRWSERELKRRGVNVYPCLIPSMQRLTARGMKLAKELRRHGLTVIESYPGAAQDIMQIPRKHAGLAYLKDGLAEFGIKKGDWYHNKVSHDELDAITSAIVGLFYLADKYEALGNDDEEYLVIPRI